MIKYVIQLTDGSYLKHNSTLPVYTYRYVMKDWEKRNTVKDIQEARFFNTKGAVSNALNGAKHVGGAKAVKVKLEITVLDD